MKFGSQVILAPNWGKGWGPLDLVSLGLALVFGTAGLPHILIRFYTVPDAKTARSSVVWAMVLIGIFYIMTTFLGFGAASILTPAHITVGGKSNGQHGGAAAGASLAGGEAFFAFISAVAFATILAVVAGLTISASTSFAHDFYTNVIHHGKERAPGEEVFVARVTAFAVGRDLHCPRHSTLQFERGVSGRPGLCRGRQRQPARDRVFDLLEAIQHQRRRVGSGRRSRQFDCADHPQPVHHGSGCGRRRGRQAASHPACCDVSARQSLASRAFRSASSAPGSALCSRVKPSAEVFASANWLCARIPVLARKSDGALARARMGRSYQIGVLAMAIAVGILVFVIFVLQPFPGSVVNVSWSGINIVAAKGPQTKNLSNAKQLNSCMLFAQITTGSCRSTSANWSRITCPPGWSSNCATRWFGTEMNHNFRWIGSTLAPDSTKPTRRGC